MRSTTSPRRAARLVVAPNADPAVIERAATLGLVVLPGVATMTEAFEALKAGASGLKLFPAKPFPPRSSGHGARCCRRRPRSIRSAASRPSASAPIGARAPNGFGIGSALYKPGAKVDEVDRAARAFVKSWNEAG